MRHIFCYEGFQHIDGSATSIVCGPDGAWSSIGPFCEPIDNQEQQQQQRLYPVNHYGVGHRTGDDKNWINNDFDPNSPDSECGRLPFIENGNIEYGKWTLGTRRKITCDSGYHLSSNDQYVTCSTGGHWVKNATCVADFQPGLNYQRLRQQPQPIQPAIPSTTPCNNDNNNGQLKNNNNNSEIEIPHWAIAIIVILLIGVLLLVIFISRPCIMEGCNTNL